MVNGVNESSPSFRPPTRNIPAGLSLTISTAPSLRPPASNRPRATFSPLYQLRPIPKTPKMSPLVQPSLPLTPLISDDSSPSPASVF